MLIKKYYFTFILLMFIAFQKSFAQVHTNSFSTIEKDFVHPPNSAKPWVFWYWLHGDVSEQGITADLNAMKEVGLGGAYLMFIQDTLKNPYYNNNARQLSENWLKLVSFAIHEAKRVGLELGIHISDGFALAGGPWISPSYRAGHAELQLC